MSWVENPAVVEWQERYNGAGPHALAVPMLVVQGIADKLTYANNTELDFNRTCKAFPTSKATLRLYPDLDHDTMGEVGFYDILNWVKDRFAGVEVAGKCATETVQPATDRFRRVGTAYSGSSV
jgi:alpha-beta hydrolase superfamily lysophospholipase